jgi:hypothetical protein
MQWRNLPPLEARTPYRAMEFQNFEYFGSALTGSEAILRLHLKNATTIDLPTNDAELKRLAIALCEAFGPDVIEHLKMRNWI